jgi:type IV pilus assembly protein PilA
VIELMIVVAVIGILAAMAVPFFRDFVIRARVSEGLVLASAAKQVVMENAANSKPYDTGFTPITLANATQNVSGLRIDNASGTITITYTAAAGGDNKNPRRGNAGDNGNDRNNGRDDSFGTTLILRPYTGSPTYPTALPDSETGAYAALPGGIKWACGAAGAAAPAVAGTLEAKYAPANCR